MAAINVLIAHPRALLRGALVALFHRQRDLRVVAEAARGSDVVAEARQSGAAVAIVDQYPPVVDAWSVARQLEEAAPGTRTLILTDADHLGIPTPQLALVDLDRVGVLTRQVSARRLLSAARDLAAGEAVMDLDLIAQAAITEQSPLTGREHEVLRLVAAGAPAAEIAGTLSMSVRTVRNHQSRINRKFGARTRIEAVRIANDGGWL
jgi:two-component system response regulator DesR